MKPVDESRSLVEKKDEVIIRDCGENDTLFRCVGSGVLVVLDPIGTVLTIVGQIIIVQNSQAFFVFALQEQCGGKFISIFMLFRL